MTASDWTAVEVTRPEGRGAFVLVCEHASHHIPEELSGLGLSEASRLSHAAWDIGALDLALALGQALDAPLVAGRISRLVYDCNRPLDAPDAIPARSERHAVPGNVALDRAECRARQAAVHDPFHAAIAELLDGRSDAPALVTIHSFTPVFDGETREVELGFLCHENEAFARAALAEERRRNRYRAELNQPYGPADGVTYTLARHGEARGLPSLMIEVRNDLIADPASAVAMARHLAGTLLAAVAHLDRAPT